VNFLRTCTSRLALALVGVVAGGLLLTTAAARAADAPAAPAGKAFPTPEDATKALLAACEKNDDAAFVEIFGAGSEDLIQSGKDPIVANERKSFAASAKEKTSYDRSKEGEGTLVIQVGPKDFPLPIPLRKTDKGWAFDTAAGRDEVINRRVGQNEYETIALCRAYIAAQVAYASKDRDGDDVREFAQKLRSTPGQHDGLYWPADAEKGEEESPLADIAAPLKDSVVGKPGPFNGYYFKILGEQTANAPGGAYNYVINGNMIAGFALVAIPAQYGSTGVKSFIVNHNGKIYEKDLGETGLQQGMAMKAFDPDSTWTVVSPEEEAKAIRFWEN
jgi:hypothetical protein